MALTDSRKKGIGLQTLLISLCIHAAAFTFMGMIVLHNDPESQGSVSVQLLKEIQQEKKLRCNPLGPRSWTIDHTNLPKKAHDMAKPLIRQGNVSLYSATEVIPILQYESTGARQPKTSLKMVYRGNSLAIPKVEVSKPVANNTMTYGSQESVLRIYERLSDLSSSSSRPAISAHKPSDPSILRDFLQAIGRKIERSKRYPEWAMDAGFEGKVVVRFTILRDGELEALPELVRSSGTEILDNAAIAAIKHAAPFPALPDSLSREWLQVELPMDFRLRKL